MSKKRQSPKALLPRTSGPIPTEKIQKAVLDIARARQRGELPRFEIGDTVDVHLNVAKQGKHRIEVLTGTVVGCSGSGEQETFTIRPLVTDSDLAREGAHDPQCVDQIEVKRSNVVRRVNLGFLRDDGGDSATSKSQPSR
jgi:large subunit ribosomal protein L19